jgi:ubiquinone/menaquinone biosynthesis C-methylase UbiE
MWIKLFGLEEVADIQSAAERLGAQHAYNLVSIVYLNRYVEIANRMRRLMDPGGTTPVRVCDLGCGLGQMSYLLQRRGFWVVPYDIGDRPGRDSLPHLRDLSLVIGPQDGKVPFQDNCFDAVLSCGVIEHVQDLDFTLAEIRRLLKPGGLFLIFFLPTAYAYSEWIHRWLGGWSHEILFSRNDVFKLLGRHGLAVLEIRTRHLLPGLRGWPSGIRRFYELLYPLLRAVEWIGERAPVVNLLCGDWECIARKV